MNVHAERASSPQPEDHPTGLHPFAVVVKPTDRCNMSCRYCYVTHKTPHPFMAPDVLKAVIQKVPCLAGKDRPIHFIWHGGEPLTLGREFFENVVSLQKESCDGREYDNCVQTNGTLLTAELIKYFVENRFAISLSLDGPRELHNLNRSFHTGEGTYDSIVQAVQLLQQQGQLVGAVAVLTTESVPRIVEIYRTMKALGVQFRINPVIAPKLSQSGLQVSPKEYGKAICKLFDLWFEDANPPHIDPIHLVVGNLMTNSVWGCDYHNGCLRDVIAINPDGGVYPCGQLAGHPEFHMGNIHDDTVDSIRASRVAEAILKRPSRMRSTCGACDFVSICGGGCMASAWLKSGDIYARDYFCTGRAMLFQHAHDRLVHELDRIRTERTGRQAV